MSDLRDWIEGLPGMGSGEEFAAALREAGGWLGESEDPAEYLKDLLVDIEMYCAVAVGWSDFLAGGRALDVREVSPRAAVVDTLARFRRAAQLDAEGAERLVLGYSGLGLGGAAAVAAGRAFLCGSRALPVLGCLHDLAIRKGNLGAAAELSELVATFHGPGPEGAYCVARTDAARGRLEEAAASLRKLLADAPAFRPAWELLTDVTLKAKDWRGTLAALEEMPGEYADNRAATLKRVRARLGSGEPLAAASALEGEILARGGDPELNALLGRILFDAGEDARAFESLQSCFEADPGQGEALLLMALIAFRNRRYHDAVELAGHLASVAPQLAGRGWLVACDAFRLAGSPEGAAEALELAHASAGADPALAIEIAKRKALLPPK